MSHITGTVQLLAAPLTIGPGSGAPPTTPNTWAVDVPFTEAPAPGTRLVMLHFQNVSLPGANRLEVDLGYDMDVFTSADGAAFWTRPIDNRAFPSGIVRVRYINTAAAPAGSAQVDRMGRGERHAGGQDPTSLSNSDPFLRDAAYTEPKYDPFWFCSEPPNWENIRQVPGNDVRAKIARSVGMIVSVHPPDRFSPVEYISTCTVTLVDTDKVVSAGHCHTPAEALTSSVIFEYETDAAGKRLSPYNPRFHKVAEALKNRNDTGFDYSLLRLKTAPAGITPIQMRPDLPAVGEQVFGVHHPNGAVKKLSFPHATFATVTDGGDKCLNVPFDFDVSGGSSGSGLFDTAGRIVGMLSRGAPCSGDPLIYFPTHNMLIDIAPAPPPPVTRDVVLVVDRSGSMSEDDGSGRTKIEAAQDAVSLFVQLVQAGTGNRAGLVSFSTSAGAPTFNIAPVTDPNKATLIGPPPFAGGLVGSLTPGGATSIGGGLAAAQAQFPTPGTNPRAILLLTDGLQNTAPFIADVEPSLAGITLHAIGLGSDANLDSALLSALAAAHGGLYTRASSGLALLKFFSNAFGNIFEAGTLLDPEFDLPADQSGEPVEFTVCGEDSLTVVAGWDRTDASLVIQLQTPAGNIVNAGTTGTETTFGRNWTYLRVPLPQGGERDGVWKVQVLRPEVIPLRSAAGSAGPALRYFLNIIPSGGPRLLREPEGTYTYTGDTISPLLRVRYSDYSWPEAVKIDLTVLRPDAGAGNILSDAGLGNTVTVDGDVLPARQATLQAIEQSTGKPAIKYIEEHFTLQEDPANTRGSFEAAGSMGIAMPDFLREEGTYTFHARATYGECDGVRELVWTMHVDVGVDPGRTDVTMDPLGPQPDGSFCQRMTFTPRDKYGNRLGPGRADDLGISPAPGSSLNGPVHDLGGGAYQVDVCSEPGSTSPPGVAIAQPGRSPVVVGPGSHQLFRYSVNFLCGIEKKNDKDCLPVTAGSYATAINLHNLSEQDALVFKRVIPIVLKGKVQGREPEVARVAAVDRVILPPHTATMDDCCRLQNLLFGDEGDSSTPLSMGVLEIISTVNLAVTAIYTKGDDTLDVQVIAPKSI